MADMRTDLRALSLKQPWLSWAILRLGKRIENRESWQGCAHRGPILLHASQGVGSQLEFSECVTQIAAISRAWPTASTVDGSYRGGVWRPAPDLPRGAVVGVARIVATVDGRSGLTPLLGGPDLSHQERWWFGGFALVLDDVHELPEPIPCKGALGLWRPPADVVARVREQLGEWP